VIGRLSPSVSAVLLLHHSELAAFSVTERKTLLLIDGQDITAPRHVCCNAINDNSNNS
jgi:hypothetical protein